MQATAHVLLSLAASLSAARARETPDISQTHPELPNGGTDYCAPAAVSNSLVWLAANGFGTLLPGDGDVDRRQLALMKLLGSKPYFATKPADGTGPAELLTGLERFLIDHGHPAKSLRYQGWRKHPKRLGTGTSKPEVTWIAASLDAVGGAWINVGWYDFEPKTNTFHRKGGHWLTVVGASPDGTLLVHDPAPRAGARPSTETLTFAPIIDGTLAGEDRRLPLPAAGFLRISGMKLPSGRDAAILDGAVALQL